MGILPVFYIFCPVALYKCTKKSYWEHTLHDLWKSVWSCFHRNSNFWKCEVLWWLEFLINLLRILNLYTSWACPSTRSSYWTEHPDETPDSFLKKKKRKKNLSAHTGPVIKRSLTHLCSSACAPLWHFWPPSTDLCLVARGGCSHQCTVAPGKGVVCFCPPGLHLDSSNRTCEVVDYCSHHLKCSQVCEQSKTTVKCSCYPGWTLDPDGDSCHSTGSLDCIYIYQEKKKKSFSLW